MKKTMVMAVAFVLAVAFSAYAEVTVTEQAKATADKTVEKVEVKTDNMKATKTVTSTPTETTVKEDVKGKLGEVKKTETITAEKAVGTTQVDVKKGAIQDLKIDWTYNKVGNDYILSYNVNENTNPALIKELGLTDDQAKALKPGPHKITSTSPYTVDDVQKNFRNVILKDLQMAAKKK